MTKKEIIHKIGELSNKIDEAETADEAKKYQVESKKLRELFKTAK